QRTIKKESLPVLVGACSALLVLAALGAMYMMGSGKIAAQQRTLDDLNRRFEALPPPPPGPTAAQQTLAGEQSARVTALSAALASRVSWDRVFREFSLVLPDDVWLTELSAKSPISPAMIAIVVGAVLLFGLAGWFLVVHPQSGKVANLKRQATDVQEKIDAYNQQVAAARSAPKIEVADVYRLAKAMPDKTDMPDLLLE